MGNLIACGRWLEFPMWKRILYTIKYWLPWVLMASWHSKHVWWRYALYKLFGKKPMTWGDFLVDAPEEEYRYVMEPSLHFYLYLSGKGRFLWWASRSDLEKSSDIPYPVDWDNRGEGWCPFW